MSITMARHGGQILLDQSDMRLSLNMAKLAQDRNLHSTIEEARYLIEKAHTEASDETMCGVMFCGLTKVNAVMERHCDMLLQNHMEGCHSCQLCTANNW
jgi:hypothetical protein